MNDITNNKAADWLVKSLERSQAEITAGESTPVKLFLDELRASIARMKAKRAAKAARHKNPRDPPNPASPKQPPRSVEALRKFGPPPPLPKTSLTSLDHAREQIASHPESGLTAPRPYRELARVGLRWIKSSPCGIYYTTTKPPLIAGIFHATADIPNRL